MVTRYNGVQWMLTVQNMKTVIRNWEIWGFNRIVVSVVASLEDLYPDDQRNIAKD